jgi:hypothetical protein
MEGKPITVLATREGLEGQTTACGWKIDDHVSFVALPSNEALGRFVALHNPANGKVTYAQVLDVGPWSEQDNAYVFGGSRPLAESNQRVMMGKPPEAHQTNGAGIDLGERVWRDLGMTDNAHIEWMFLPLTFSD